MGKNRLEISFTGTMRESDVVRFSYKINDTITVFQEIKWVSVLFYNAQDSLWFFTRQAIPYAVWLKEYANYVFDNYDAINYKEQVIEADTSNLFTVTQQGNKVIIQSNVEGLEFLDFFATTGSGVSFNYVEDNTVLDNYEIDFARVVSGDCTEVNYEVQTSIDTFKVLEPFELEVNANTFNFQYLRNQEFWLKVIDIHGRIEQKRITTPKKLLSSYITYDYINNTLTVRYNPLIELKNQLLEYSIDGVNFYSNNVFNTTDSELTIYVRDLFGCSVSKRIILNTQINTKEPYIFMSKTNSLRFAEREEWNDIDVFKTDENTLSCEVLDQVKHKEVQRFQTNDIITTQLRTNYDRVSAFIMTENGEQPLSVFKVREFLNVNDYRDCILLPYSGKTLVIFKTGSTYNFDTGTKKGDYELNGNLPYWYEVGKIVSLDSLGTFEIKEVIYSEEHNAEGFVVDYALTGQGYINRLKITYNIHSYNLFELTNDFSSFSDKNLRVKLKLEDDLLDEEVFVSELINVKEKQKGCLYIEYFSKNNGDILYETGITNKLRIPFEKITNNPVSEVEIHKGDTTITQTEAEYYEGDTFIFSPQTKEMSKKLFFALIHPELYINGVKYISQEKPKEEQFEDSNLYQITASLLKAGKGFKTLNNYKQRENISIEVPRLLSNGEGGFISY